MWHIVTSNNPSRIANSDYSDACVQPSTVHTAVAANVVTQNKVYFTTSFGCVDLNCWKLRRSHLIRKSTPETFTNMVYELEIGRNAKTTVLKFHSDSTYCYKIISEKQYNTAVKWLVVHSTFVHNELTLCTCFYSCCSKLTL